MDQALLDKTRSFGPFRLELRDQALYRGDARIPLGSRAFAILCVLTERPDELIGQDELLRRVWAEVHVEPSILRVHVSLLRKALGDNAAEPRYIANAAGRGYRLVVDPSAFSAAGTNGAAPSSNIRSDFRLRPDRVFGREEAVATILDELALRRFLTITGPGGIGKTTVALSVAEQASRDAERHHVVVDLAPINNSALVASAIAAALKLKSQSPIAIGDIVSYLRNRSLLLILDSCEHLVDAVGMLAEQIFAAAKDVTILATSREPLRATGEWVHRLSPLPVPSASSGLTAAEALAAPAVQLFVERAKAADITFELTDADAPAAAEICRQLDGLPLAIELAAARADLFGIQDLAARLNDRISVLNVGRRTALPRHRTLRATLDWSYQLLRDADRALLRALAVFRGSVTFEAISAMIGDSQPDSTAVLDGIERLVAASLLATVATGEEMQYRLLELPRAYALEKLFESGRHPLLARRHAACCLAQLRSMEQVWESKRADQSFTGYAQILDDVRAALEWTFDEEGDPSIGVALTSTAATLFFTLSLLDEFQGWARRALEVVRLGAANHAAFEAPLNLSLGFAIFNSRGPTPEMTACFSQAFDAAARSGNTMNELQALWGLAKDRCAQGENSAALVFCRKFDAVARRLDNPATNVARDRMMALGLHLNGQHAMARPFGERAVAASAELTRGAHKRFHEYDGRVAARSHLSRILWVQGFADAARNMVEDGVGLATALNHVPPLCYILVYAACPIALWTGDREALAKYIGLLTQFAGPSMTFWRSWRDCYQAIADLGENDGTAEFHERRRAVRASAFSPDHRDLLSTIHGDFAEAIDFARANAHPGWAAPELMRVEGNRMFTNEAGPSGAEAVLRKSLELSREHEALAWELRGATSLARLLQRTDRPREARSILAPVYDRFGDGLRTVDLRTAQAVLQEL